MDENYIAIQIKILKAASMVNIQISQAYIC